MTSDYISSLDLTHLFTLPPEGSEWYPFFNRKEFLETVMRHTAFMAECISSLYSLPPLETLEKIYDSDFYDELEHIESDNYRISPFWSYYQMCQELGLKPLKNLTEITKNEKFERNPGLIYLIWTIEYSKLYLVNDNGQSPSGWNILQHFKRIGVTEVFAERYPLLKEEKVSEQAFAEDLAEMYPVKGFAFCKET